MAKVVTNVVKLHVAAGKANPAPPVGTALGPTGINIQEFCKAFNEQSSGFDAGAKVPVKITIYKDRSFSFAMGTPVASGQVKKAAGVEKGSATPHTEKVGKITRAQLEAIAQSKLDSGELTAKDLDAAMRTIAGTARSAGIEVENQ